MQVYKINNPLVSIILPTFNRKNYLPRAINSVLNQTTKYWELIVVDDGSDDNSYEFVNQLLMNHESIRYLRHSNRKLPLTLNAGILAACGDFIAFIGSDDEYSSNFISERIDFMLANPDIDLIHGGVKIIGDPYVKDKNDLSKNIHLSECTIGGTFFGKKKIFIELNGFKNLTYSEDSDFYERAVSKFCCRKVELSPYIYYRDTPDSICSTIS